MKNKHIQIRIEQCLSLAKASGCPRRKLGALLIDPTRNVILADGYNGGPRGAEGTLCEGFWCSRNGLKHEDIEIKPGSEHKYHRAGGSSQVQVLRVMVNGGVIKTFRKEMLEKLTEQTTFGPFDFPEENDASHPLSELKGHVPAKIIPSTMDRAVAWVEEMVAANPPIKSGTMMEKGCHHAEMNVICNASAGGIRTTGAWMIVLAEPCMMCAKLIHHSGIAKVIVVDGGYAGGKAGVVYLRKNGVKVDEIEGPKDPRLEVADEQSPAP
jgi:deoxycytidylate deaminase